MYQKIQNLKYGQIRPHIRPENMAGFRPEPDMISGVTLIATDPHHAAC